MPKFVIEREIPGAGELTPEQLKAISLHLPGRRDDSQARADGQISGEPHLANPDDHRSYDRRIR
jgi:hypothetical protein